METYRYVAERLCHRVRNSMTGPAQHLRTLETLLNGGTDAKSLEAKGAVTQLKDSLRALSRIVEFDIDDNHGSAGFHARGHFRLSDLVAGNQFFQLQRQRLLHGEFLNLFQNAFFCQKVPEVTAPMNSFFHKLMCIKKDTSVKILVPKGGLYLPVVANYGCVPSVPPW